MPKGYVIGNTGAGKTLFASLYAIIWAQKHPNGHIYANYHLNIPNFHNFHFTPLMFLPFSELKECLIIFDDVSNLDEVKRLSKVLANRSRKQALELFFTAQYYTMIPKQLRKIMDYKIKTYFDESHDLLTVKKLVREIGLEIIEFKDAIKTVKDLNLYDTNEVVDEPTESDIIEEIIRISKDKREVEKNLMIYSGNRQERKSLLKEILKRMSNIEDEEEEEWNYTELLVLNQIESISLNRLSLDIGIPETTLFRNLKKTLHHIKQKYLKAIS